MKRALLIAGLLLLTAASRATGADWRQLPPAAFPMDVCKVAFDYPVQMDGNIGVPRFTTMSHGATLGMQFLERPEGWEFRFGRPRLRATYEEGPRSKLITVEGLTCTKGSTTGACILVLITTREGSKRETCSLAPEGTSTTVPRLKLQTCPREIWDCRN